MTDHLTTLSARRLLWPLVACYVVLATLYSIVTPIFEASDELWHYPMVQVIATNNFALPVQDPAVQTPWRQEGSQPPLYYLLAAALTSGIDTGNLDAIRRINPHADIGIVRPPFSANMIVHRPDAESFPWQGAALAVHVARLFSVALGALTVIVTFRTASALFPDRPGVIVGATALNAFLPMFVFISGSVNNDNLSNLLGNLLVLLIVLMLQQNSRPTLRQTIIIGIVTGAGLLAKLNIGFLIPVIGLSFLAASIRHRSVRPLLMGFFVSGGITILIAGWWYLRNVQLYGDPTGLNVFLDVVGRRPIVAGLGTLWAERGSFLAAFWGMFGGMNVPLPDALYATANTLGGIGLLGALSFFVKTAMRREWTATRWLPFVPPLLWLIVTFVSYLRWTADTPASQGRLIFGALSTISILFALGLSWWLPRLLRPIPLTAFAGLLGMTALLAPFLVIQPAYTPTRLPASAIDQTDTEFSDRDGGLIALNTDAIALPESVRPGEDVLFDLVWQVVSPTRRDWSLFVHLVTQDGVIIAQRDMYPARGLLATSDLEANSAWLHPVAVTVPALAPAPLTLSVVVGWYALDSMERMTLPDGSDSLTLGTVLLEPRPISESETPININFGQQMRLIDYDISTLAPLPGETVTVTLTWQAIQPMTADYTVFVQILDRATLRKAGESNAQPAAWTRPTTTWGTGDIIIDTHTLVISQDAMPETYMLEVGAYLLTPENAFERLHVIAPDGSANDDFVGLTRMRVLAAELSP